MKKGKVSIKKKISKKIEQRRDKHIYIVKRKDVKSGDMSRKIDEIREKNRILNKKIEPSVARKITSKINDHLKKNNLSRNEVRSNTKKKSKKVVNEWKPYEVKDYGVYEKPDNVDYDVMLYVSSYNRYAKVKRILDQLYNQPTKYSFKVVLMNDGSTQTEYKKIPEIYPDIIYLENEMNYGRNLYWKTKNKIFNEIKKYTTHAVIQIDDDFLLSKSFIDKLMIIFFNLKKIDNSYMGVRYHIPSFDKDVPLDPEYFNEDKFFQAFDGGSMFDAQFLRLIDYRLGEVNPDIFKLEFQHSQVWSTLNDLVIKHGVKVFRTRVSFAYHDGNDDSKMHPVLRKLRNIHTKNFNDE